MNSSLKAMMSVLSDEDRQDFIEISHKLKENGGDVTQLDAEEIELIHAMEMKYQAKIQAAYESADGDIIRPDILYTEFSEFCRRRLDDEFGGLSLHYSEVLEKVVDSKLIPHDFLDENIAKELYTEFQEDVDNICNFADVGEAKLEREPHVLLGLAWFMVVYQFKIENLA
jgi:hypothetical protein